MLDELFNEPLAHSGKAYVLGHPDEGLQWHIYVAGLPRANKATFNLEICMTELGEANALQFVRTDKFVSASQTTKDSGILELKPKAIIDDYVFEPCGYSMNGIDGTGLMTIHITPEPGFSYASLEVSGFVEDIPKPDALLADALKIFHPGKVSICISVDQADGIDEELAMLASLPLGYSCHGASTQKLDCGGAISFYNSARVDGLCQELMSHRSPKSMRHSGSYLSISSMDRRQGGSVASIDMSGLAGSECEMAAAEVQQQLDQLVAA